MKLLLDGPVEDILPIEAMRAAIERKDGNGGTFMPEQCLTFEETILLFTKGKVIYINPNISVFFS